MQGHSAPSLLYDEGFFGRPELNFNDNGPGSEPNISSGLLGLSESIHRLDTTSSFNNGSSQQAMGDASLSASASPGNGPPTGAHPNDNIANHNNSFKIDKNGNLLMRDTDNRSKIMNVNAISNDNSGNGQASVVDHINLGGAGETSSLVDPSNGVTSQWEESMQDLQSLLALHGQQHSQIVNGGLTMTPDNGPAFTNSIMRASGGYSFEKGHAGCSTGAYPNSKLSSAADLDLLSILHFPRSNSSSLQQQQQILQAPAGPVSAFPSNPGFRKGSGGSVSSAGNMQIPSVTGGPYSSSSARIVQNSSSFLYPTQSLLGSAYFNLNPGALGNLSSFANHVATPMMQNHQLMGAPSIIDLDQERDHCSEDRIGGHGDATTSAVAGKFSSSLLESAKRSGSEGSLLVAGKGGSEPRGINHFATERQRREYLNEKYQTLRSLVPNPSKSNTRRTLKLASFGGFGVHVQTGLDQHHF